MRIKGITDLSRIMEKENYFLYQCLIGLNGEKKVERIQQLFIDVIGTEKIETGTIGTEKTLTGMMETANDILLLVWPTMAITYLAAPVICSSEIPKAYDIRLQNLAATDQISLETLLKHYATFLNKALIHLVDITPIPPMPTIRLVAHELLCTTHLMNDLTYARPFFSNVIGCLAGYHFPSTKPDEKGPIDEAPEIIRNSLQDIPVRDGQNIDDKLLAYLLETKIARDKEDGRKQCEIIDHIIRVVLMAYCKKCTSSVYAAILSVAQARFKKVLTQ